MDTLSDNLLRRIMWTVFRGINYGAATICRGQLVNKQWHRCYGELDKVGRNYMMWIMSPSWVPNDPKLVHRYAFYEPSRPKLVENRKRASRQSKTARFLCMTLSEWRRHEARRLNTTVTAIKNGCTGTVQ